MAESQRDVIEILTHDHREVEQVFAELEGLRGVTDEQGRTRRKDLVDHRPPSNSCATRSLKRPRCIRG
jgi:hypothetical protein